MLRIAIIEDEPAAVQLLSSIINEYCDGVTIVDCASNVADGLVLLAKSDIDVVFVDIRLGSETIFELLAQIEYTRYKIVFTTAYSDHALDAFKYEAIDYILKPYSPKQIIKVIEKLKKSMPTFDQKDLGKLFDAMQQAKSSRISINTNEGISFIDPSDIIHCTADGAYCKIASRQDGKIFVSKTLGEIESQLNPAQFIRIHASHVINMEHIKKFLKDDGGFVLMSDGTQIPVSRRKKQEFMERVK